MEEVFALIDCNNFFASCERSFNPKLVNRPLVILSNNDGCVITRSEEAKRLGITMGQAAHKLKAKFKNNEIIMLSSNFSLYGDISRRVMKILSQFSPQQEVYSIDESFLRLNTLHISDYKEYGRGIVETVRRSLGIPVSIGIAHSKTLAKAANKLAKHKYEEGKGVSILMEEEQIDSYLRIVEVGEIWGIGYQTTKFLNSKGIYTAFDFKKASSAWIRENLGINGARTQLELYGKSCLEFQDELEDKKGILSSRSFRNYILEKDDLKEAVSTYIARASEKLRKQRSLATNLTVAIMTNRHKINTSQYFNSYSIELPYPTNYNPDLIQSGLNALDAIYKPGYSYKKASVYLSGLVPEKAYQYNLFEENSHKKYELMKALDSINNKLGGETVFYACQGSLQPWRSKQENTSPAYTRKWDELPIAR